MLPWIPFLLLAALTGAAQQAPAEEGWRALAEQHGQAEQASLDEAIDAYQRFLEAHPEGEYSTAARFRLASLLMGQAEARGAPPAYGPAVAQLERVIAAVERGEAGAFESEAEAWYLLGRCLRDLGPQRASQAWQRVVQLAPGTELAASAQLQLGEQAAAIEDWALAATMFAAAATSADPGTSAKATFMAGWALHRQRSWDQASAAFAAVLGLEAPDAPRDEALQYLALVMVERSQDESRGVDAVLDSTLALVPASHHAALLQQAATLLDGMARFDEAELLRDRATRGERDAPRRRRERVGEGG
jgi:tetratricopeptide (TPR) repeat protein